MNAEIFSEWLRRQGHQVFRTESSYWYDAFPRVFQAFPYHWVIEPSEKELRSLLMKKNAIALRYSAPINAPCGKISYHVICDDLDYNLLSLRRQARQNVKRGLKYGIIEPIPIHTLASEGWRLRLDTLERQGRTDAETEDWWRRLCTSAQDLPGFEAWGAIHKGQLAASFLSFRCDDCFMLPYEQSATDHLKSRVNNAIFYFVTHEAFKLDGISSVFFCPQSLDAPTSVDQFKFRMGYRAKPVRQRVVFHPFLAHFFNTATYTVVRRMLGCRQNNTFLAKLEGMFRFYIEGNRPSNEQDWPECLLNRKMEFLEA